MKWFGRLLLQLAIIAILLATPLYLVPLWPGIAILCWLPAIGLMAYGLSNPEYAFRRIILWAVTAVITSSAISNSALQNVRDQLEGLGASSLMMFLFDVLTALFVKVELGWTVVAVILLVCALEGLRMTFESGVWLNEKPTVRIIPATSRSFIATQVYQGNKFVMSASFTISNWSDETIEVSGSTARIIRLNVQGELYSKDQIDEITAKHMYYIGPKTSKEFNLICRNIPSGITKFLGFLSTTRLNYLVDITGRVFPLGNHALDGKYHKVTFDFPSKRAIMQPR